MYRGRGIAIWHWQDMRNPLMPEELTFPHALDLETPTGKYSDPGTWLIPDPVGGMDNMDVWYDRPNDCVYGNINGFAAYAGASTDFWSAGSTFAYWTNPSTLGMSPRSVGFPNPPVDPFLLQLQNTQNSVIIRVKEDYGSSALIDILLAPYEDILSPNGGEVVYVGESTQISWRTDYVLGNPNGIIDLVDIHLDKGDGSPLIDIAIGINATQGSYEWIPDASMMTGNARIKLVYHNVNDATHVGDDYSDGEFEILPSRPPVFVDRSLNDQGQEQIPYQALPYSCASINYDEIGPRDIAISFLDSDLEIHRSLDLSADGAIPQFQYIPQAFGAGSAPEDLLGVTVADIDSDGDEDFFAASQASPRLYSRESDGKYYDMSAAWGVNQSLILSTAGAWADFDRDGDVDLIVGTADCVGEEPGYGDLAGGTPDVLLRNDLTTGGGFTDISAAIGSASTYATTVAWADVDMDGYPDIFVGEARGSTGSQSGPHSRILMNQSDGSFADESASRLGFVGSARGAVWRDMDNDGDLDIEYAAAWCRAAFENDGGGVFSNVISEFTSMNKPYSGVRIFDHDLDGNEDVLLLPGAVDDRPRLLQHFREAGTSSFQNITTYAGIDMLGKIGGAVAADMNGDGDTDLFLGRDAPRNMQGAPTGDASQYLFQAAAGDGMVDEPAHRWLGARLSSPGKLNNRSAIGAKVTLTVNGQPRVRYVDGGSGRGSQDDKMIVFGLGDDPVLGDLVVDWPNAHQQVVPAGQLNVDAVNEIVDDSSLIVTAGSLSVEMQIVPGTLDMDWIFSWETSVWTNPDLDRVTFETGSMTPACAEGLIDIHPGLYTVDHSVNALSGSRQLHTLIWRNRPCVSQCTIVYQAHSRVNDVTTSTSVKSFNVGFCPQ